MLAAMFSGRHSLIQDSRGRYFIDRPGESFAVILEWLQTGCFLWPDSECAKRRIKLELEYFGLVEALYGGNQRPTSNGCLCRLVCCVPFMYCFACCIVSCVCVCVWCVCVCVCVVLRQLASSGSWMVRDTQHFCRGPNRLFLSWPQVRSWTR
jgi:hypothetical protein